MQPINNWASRFCGVFFEGILQDWLNQTNTSQDLFNLINASRFCGASQDLFNLINTYRFCGALLDEKLKSLLLQNEHSEVYGDKLKVCYNKQACLIQRDSVLIFDKLL